MSFRCHCGNLVGLGMDLQRDRINRSHSKSSTSNHRIPDYFSQVLIRGMDTGPVCSGVLTSARSPIASGQTSDDVFWPIAVVQLPTKSHSLPPDERPQLPRTQT